MIESNTKFSQQIRVFVYGTLKPGEANYQKYCAGKVVNINRAVTLGKLFALPMGYPAMTLGQDQVHGYLLSFSDKDGLKIHADVNGAFNIGRKCNPEGFDCIKSILRDRGCLVVHPRRITPLFRPVRAQSGVA